MACEVALEAAHRLDAGLTLGFLAGEIGTGLGVDPAAVIAMTCSARLSWRLHDADRQTTSQPTAGPDLNRPVGRQHERPKSTVSAS